MRFMLKRFINIGVFLIMALQVQAQNLVDPKDYLIGMDIETINTEAFMTANDMYFFGSTRPLGSGGGAVQRINMNNAFYKGMTQIKFRFKMGVAEGVSSPEFKFRFSYWKSGELDSFPNDKPYAIEAHFFVEKDENGKEIIKYTEREPGQDYMKASPIVVSPSQLQLGEWTEVSFNLSSQFDFMPANWSDAVILKDNKKTRDEIFAELRRVNDRFIAKDYDFMAEFFLPVSEQYARAYGLSVDDAFEENYEPYLVETRDAQPILEDDLVLKFVQGNRIVSVLPYAFKFIDRETSRSGRLYANIWKDQSGNWHLAN